MAARGARASEDDAGDRCPRHQHLAVRERWYRLRDAARDAEDDGPQPMAVMEAHDRLRWARVELDRHTTRGPQGHRDQFTSQADIQAAFERDKAELQRRIEAADQEVKRLQARSSACAAKRNQLNWLVEECRRWAAEQRPPITLPGDDALLRGALRDISAGQPLPTGRVLSPQPGGA